MLRKSDWQVLEEIAEAGTFSHQTYLDKYHKKLNRYPLDLDGVFEEETRVADPRTIIQISELSGDMLLFLPRWEYEGTIVEDYKADFRIFEGVKRVTYVRDKKAEQKTLELLQNAHPKFKEQSSFFLKFEEASKNNWFFNFYHEQLKDNFTITGMDMLGYFRYSDYEVLSNLSITETVDNMVRAQFTTHFGVEKIDTKILQRILKQGDRFVLLKDNSLGVLSDDWLEKYAQLVKNAKVDGDEIQFTKWLLISDPVHNQSSLNKVLSKNWLEKWNRWDQSDDQLYEKPDFVLANLRNYQQKGFEWLNLMAEVNAGTLLADDMGLGKTLQTISALAYWLKINPKSKFLIICPASLIYNWNNEFEKFAPNFNLFIYHGSQRDIRHFLEGDNQVLITSYAIIRNDNQLMAEIPWEAIVLDENHHIKNYNAKQTQAVLKLNGKRRIILNGTPIMNKITDLFPQLHFLLPQLFPSQKEFKEQFETPLTSIKAEEQMDTLKKLTSPFILRRTKETAAPDLPQKTESVLWCEMAKEQRSAYEEIKSQVKDNIMVEIKDKGLNKSKLGVLQGITKLRQVCSSPRLLKEEESDFHNSPSIKIDNLIETLTSDLADKKVIVFSQFIGTMDLLSQAFEENEITYRRFSGKTAAKERIRLVSEFQEEDSDIQVFLLSLMAGNSGINLTNANYVFLMEPWWNKAVQQQAIDRTHRIGQNQKVFAYNMICKDTIEEKIMALQEKKQILSDEVIADDGNFLRNLTTDDIAFLFE